MCAGAALCDVWELLGRSLIVTTTSGKPRLYDTSRPRSFVHPHLDRTLPPRICIGRSPGTPKLDGRRALDSPITDQTYAGAEPLARHILCMWPRTVECPRSSAATSLRCLSCVRAGNMRVSREMYPLSHHRPRATLDLSGASLRTPAYLLSLDWGRSILYPIDTRRAEHRAFRYAVIPGLNADNRFLTGPFLVWTGNQDKHGNTDWALSISTAIPSRVYLTLSQCSLVNAPGPPMAALKEAGTPGTRERELSI